MFLEMKNQIWVERSGTAKPRVKRTRAQLNGNSWSEGKDLTQLVEIKSLVFFLLKGNVKHEVH